MLVTLSADDVRGGGANCWDCPPAKAIRRAEPAALIAIVGLELVKLTMRPGSPVHGRTYPTPPAVVRWLHAFDAARTQRRPPPFPITFELADAMEEPL